jgi:sugar phosphate isomerase/epimerase
MPFLPVLHSVSYAGLWGQAALGVDGFVEKAAALGYRGVLLTAKRPHVSVLDYGQEDRARLRERLQAAGMQRIVIAGYNNFTADLEHGEVPMREIMVGHIVDLARLARDLGGDLVRVFSGYESPARGYGDQWKLVVESLREAARRAGDLGITLGLQNHHDLGAGWEQFGDLLAAVNDPHCKACFDAWAPALHGADLAKAARTLAPWVVHTTVADYQLRPRFKYQPAIVNYEAQTPAVLAVPMGEGFIDYTSFLRELPPVSIAYEMCSPLRDGASMETLDKYAVRFLEWLNSLAL